MTQVPLLGHHLLQLITQRIIVHYVGCLDYLLLIMIIYPIHILQIISQIDLPLIFANGVHKLHFSYWALLLTNGFHRFLVSNLS